MSRRSFDRFMVGLETGRDLKLRPLTDSEWRCFIGGVLPIAAKSPIRGRLLIADRPADPEDVAEQAGVKRAAAARSVMVKLREIGILEPDHEFGCEQVRHFDEWNPPPKKDTTAAERQARRRARLAANGVTGESR